MTNIKKWKEDNHWVEIDIDRCMRSGHCQNICPDGVYKVINGKVVSTEFKKTNSFKQIHCSIV